MSGRDCPDCDTRMQPFWLPSSKVEGAEVELDRCNDCGGVWFDAGELAEATRRAVTPGTQRTDRQCPECQVPLVQGALARLAEESDGERSRRRRHAEESSVDVETCAQCKGTFLEARDMDALTKRPAPKKTASAVGGTGFVCDGCGERKPFSLAQPTLTGMECDVCVAANKHPPAAPEQAERAGVFGKFLGWLKGE